MAKKRIVKKYRRKGRWSANIKKLTTQNIAATPNSNFYATADLCQNPVQSDSSVSQQYTVKNVELSFEFEMPTNESQQYLLIEGIVCYIMYVPQGMNIDENYPNYHPEYIMAMRFLGSPNIEYQQGTLIPAGRNPLRIKTRLARRLQTGDKIILYINGNNTSTATVNLNFNGLIRWWTKAN